MTEKVQEILSEIAIRKLCTMDEHMAFYNNTAKEDYRFLSEIEELIKALQEEPVELKEVNLEDSKKEEPQVKEMTEAHLEKYCQMCFQHNFCHLFNWDKPRIETCLIRSGIENGYKKAIDDIEQQTNKDFLCWRRAFECVAETPDGKSTHEDIWTLDTERGFLYYIPAGSTTARCLLLKDLLDKLPKENGL